MVRIAKLEYVSGKNVVIDELTLPTSDFVVRVRCDDPSRSFAQIHWK